MVDARFVTGHEGWPPPRLGDSLTAFALELTSRTAKQRSREILLLELFLPEQRLAAWETWWHKIVKLERAGKRYHDRRTADLSFADLEAVNDLEKAVSALENPFSIGPHSFRPCEQRATPPPPFSPN